MPKPRVAPTTASITLNGKTGTSRYGKRSGPSGRRRQPTNPAQSAFRMTGWFGMVFPLITPDARLLCSRFGAGQFRAGDPVEILENKEQTPRLEGAPVPLPAAHPRRREKRWRGPRVSGFTLPL